MKEGGPVAQFGLEHLAHNQVDVGSNPIRPTKFFIPFVL